MSNQAGILDRVRNPEHTGDNRCTPCTAVNVALAALFAGLLALVASAVAGATLAGGLGATAFAGSVLLIYLRGYLVPGTPALTTRYLPDRVLRWFDREPAGQNQLSAALDERLDEMEQQRERRVDPAEFLLEAGAVERADGELTPTAAFSERVSEQLRALREDATATPTAADAATDTTRETPETATDATFDRERVARLLDADVTEVSVKERAYPAVSVDSRVRKWPSVAAVRADSATDEALRATTDDWPAVPVNQRVQILRALRAFRDRCPLCAGALEQTSEPVESCCVSGEVVALTCRDCNRPLLERSPDADAWLSLADV